ncbi:flagellar motor switch protein FliM [Cryobacterium sp. CAN_C3]|uniref:flagellar motor switch protein FliM n=1 Tax=unclassified Cryobacterium TaxID=2649013 RepID=UPI0018CAF5C9|nr:flagellar motor switch protein FliM [Cryobacterium sp. CAN_C3]MEC5153980.1 flagellar motor switch protein FliM [Cryobacterium sp. CAN_C3]
MTVQEHVETSAPTKAPKPVELYDFRRPTTLARDHARVLELACETFARQWGTQITARVRALCTITCDQVLMATYDEYAASLPAKTAMVLCTIAGIEARAVFQFPTSTGLTWVNHMLGGNGTQVIPAERTFTQIELALVRQLMTEGLEDLRYSFGPLLVHDIAVEAIQFNSQFAQAAATGDHMIVANFSIRVEKVTVAATLAIPATALIPQLGEVNPTMTGTNSAEFLKAQIAAVPVEVSLRLTPAHVLPSRILSLAVGDVLPVPHPKHRPLDLAVGGQPLARAAVGANGSRLACIIIDTEEKTQ